MAVDSPVAQLIHAHRLRPIELLPWVIGAAGYFLASGYLPLGSQIMIMESAVGTTGAAVGSSAQSPRGKLTTVTVDSALSWGD